MDQNPSSFCTISFFDMIECLFMRLAASSKGLLMEEAEPEAEESPGVAGTEEGLAEAFSRLAVSEPRRPVAPEAPRAERSALPPFLRSVPSRTLELGDRRGFEFSDPRVPGERGLEILSRALSERYPSNRTGLELRYYVVWLVPNHTGEEQLSGLHVGLDSSAYSALIRANQGVFEGLRWRRVRSLILARRAFLAEAERQNVDRERVDHLFWWP